jgi:hypothetical protein
VSAKPTQRFLLVMYFTIPDEAGAADFGGATALNCSWLLLK